MRLAVPALLFVCAIATGAESDVETRRMDHQRKIAEILEARRNGNGNPNEHLDAKVPLESRLQKLRLPSFEASGRVTLGVSFVDLETSWTIYRHGAERLMTPASTLKSYTSSCALSTWPADHRFTTSVRSTAPVVSGELKGDLVLAGGGDSMLTVEGLRDLAMRVKTTGLTRVSGDLVVDVSRFGAPPHGPGWMWDDEADYYNMAVSPLMLNFNVVKVAVAEFKGGEPIVTLDPPTALPLEMIPVEGATEVVIRRIPTTETVRVEFPASGPYAAATARLAVRNPEGWIGQTFRDLLAENGIAVSGSIRVTREPVGGTEIAAHQGPPLPETIRHFHKVSENAVGEMLLLEMATQQTGEPGTWPAGATYVTEWLTKTARVPAGSFRVVDGSGLSRYNLISGDSTTALMSHMWRSPLRETFLETLTVYEVDALDPQTGLVIKRPAVRAKTGGMSSVTTLVGYVENEGGKTIAFAWLANGYIGDHQWISNVRNKMLATVAASGRDEPPPLPRE